MPEITDAELRTFAAYQNLGTPQEIAKKIGDLEGDNHKQRDEIRDLKEKQLKDGEVALPKEKAEVLTSYEALGKPEDLQKVVTERDELQQKDQQRTREDAFRAAVKAAGWPEDTVATLLDMRSLDGAAVEVKREKNEKGEDAEVPYVKLAGEGQQPQKLTEFAANTPQLKGLKTEAAKNEESGGRSYTRQAGTGTSADEGKSLIDQQITKNREAATGANPLRPVAAKA